MGEKSKLSPDSRMTRIMGSRYNPSYATQAKDNAWVDSPKLGHHVLQTSWTSILSQLYAIRRC